MGSRMKGKLHVKIEGKAREYYDQGLREMKAGRPDDALTSFNNCKTIMRQSCLAVDDVIVMAATELGKDQYLKTKNSAWFVKASEGALKMCTDYGKETYKPWLRRAKVLYAGKLYDQALLTVDKVFAHPTYATADSKVHESVLAFENQLRGHVKHRKLMVENEEELKQLAKDLKAEMVYKTTTNFIRTLPPDALMCIADAGLAMEQGFVLRMGGVCRAWRKVVTERAGLWDTLELGGHRPVAKAALWMRRADHRLRELRFTKNLQPDKVNAVLEAADAAFDQLQSLSLSISSPIDNGLLGRFSKLQKLTLAPGVAGLAISDLDGGLMKRNSSSLRNLVLEGVQIYDGILASADHGGWVAPPRKPSGPVLDDVRSLCLSNCNFHSASSDSNSFAKQVTRLKRLQTLRFERFSTAYHPSSDPSNMLGNSDDEDDASCMEELVEYAISRGTGPLLSCRMPRLEELDFWACYTESPTLIGYIKTQIQPFSPSLVSLDLGRSLLPRSLIPLLKDLPSLKFLGVSQSGLDDQFLEKLNGKTPDDEIVLPNLEAISLAGNEFTTLAVRDFVMKRVPLSEWVAAAPAAAPPANKAGGSFRPAKAQKTGGGMFKPKPSSSSSSTLSRTGSGSGGLVSGRPSRALPLPIPSLSLAPPTIASQALSQPAPISPSALEPPNSLTSVTAAAGSQEPSPTRVRKIQWINLDGCQLIDPSLEAHLVKFVRFVSIAPGQLNEDRVRAKGQWSWKGDWKETCRNSTKCRLIPAPHKKEEWEVRHYCTADAAAEALKIPSFSQIPKTTR